MSQSYGNSLRWECCRCYHTNRSSVDILCSSRSCRHVKCTLCQSMTLSSLPSSIVPSNVVPSSSLLSSSSSVPSSSLSLPLSLSSRVVASWNCHHCSFANTRYSYMCEICLRDRDRTNRAPIVTNATSSPSFSLSSSSSVASLQPSYQLSSQLLLDTNDSKRSSPAVSQMVTGESKHMGANDGHNSNGIKGDIHHDNRASNSNGDINHNHGDDGHAPLSRQAQWVYDNSYNHGALLSHSRPSLSSLSSSSQRWQRFDEEYQDKIELAFMQKQRYVEVQGSERWQRFKLDLESLIAIDTLMNNTKYILRLPNIDAWLHVEALSRVNDALLDDTSLSSFVRTIQTI